ncbi:MAG: hypothetical protein WDN67_05535 [Candidatus Moraniibacteriota bacterium]
MILCEDREFSEYFEAVASELEEKKQSGEIADPKGRMLRLATNYLLTEVRRHLQNLGQKIGDLPITPENYAEFIGFIADEKINSSAAQRVLGEMYQASGNDTDDPSKIIERLNLTQVSDEGALAEALERVLMANEQSVSDYRAGKENAFKFLMGQVMKETQGKANPQIVTELLKKSLK